MQLNKLAVANSLNPSNNQLSYNSENLEFLVIYYIFFFFYRGLISEKRGHGKNEIAIRNLWSRLN